MARLSIRMAARRLLRAIRRERRKEPNGAARVARTLLIESDASGAPLIHPLFDAAWYAERYDDVPRRPLDAFLHFVDFGAAENRDPHPLFDAAWYARVHPDVSSTGMPSFLHYLAFGAAERRDPHPLFDVSHYAAHVPDLDLAANPLIHFVTVGSARGVSPHPLFDRSWYVVRSGHAIGRNEDPFVHFVRIGDKELRSPHPAFDPQHYLLHNSDVAAAGLAPFRHFVEFGAAEGRSPHALFDPRWYDPRDEGESGLRRTTIRQLASSALAQSRSPHPFFDAAWYARRHPDVGGGPGPAFLHFLRHGIPAGLDPHPLFSTRWYLRRYADVAESGTPAFLHFVHNGVAEDRDPHPFFSTAWYREHGPQEEVCGMLPFVHFLARGARERRDPHPLFDSLWYEGQLEHTRPVLNLLAHFIEEGSKNSLSPHPLFDPDWYARSTKCASGRQPDFVRDLFDERLGVADPHPLFDTRFYLEQVVDRDEAASNPLLHYITIGAERGYAPHPLFDRDWYVGGNPSVPSRGAVPFIHFVREGDRQGLSGHPLFDPSYYLRNNPEVAASGIGPLRHYVVHGGSEWRNPHPMFDTQYYSWLYPSLREMGINPLVHYLSQPREQRRHPHPLFDGAHQVLTSALSRLTQIDPLRDYVEFRSRLDPDLVARHATSVPMPVRGPLPDRTSPAVLQRTPLVSMLMPTYNGQGHFLLEAIATIRAQTYENWELIVIDDGSSSPEVPELLERIEAIGDDRIRVIRRPKNGGISQATNDGLRAASGEFIALVDHDDLLTLDALHEMVALFESTSADVAYSDQAYVSASNTYQSAFHKPDWSPTLLTGVMYVGHLLVVRRDLAQRIGGFDGRYDRVQDFEFMLRVSECTKAIAHLPRDLYHWRMIPGSLAHDSNSKGAIEPIQAAAVNAHFKRTSFPAEAVPFPGVPHRLSIVPLPRMRYPSIDVLVRGDRSSKRAESCAADLALHQAKFQRITIVAAERERVHSRNGARAADTVVTEFAKAIAASDAEFLLVVDPAVARRNALWLDYLLMYAERDDIAFVGPHLYREDGRVACAGLVATVDAGLVPAMQNGRLGEDGYAGSLACDREVSALPPALLIVGRAKLERLGGIGAHYLSPLYAFGDAALRARDQGMRNIAIASPLIRVDETYDAIEPNAAIDALLLSDIALSTLDRDPYYNPNFREAAADYASR